MSYRSDLTDTPIAEQTRAALTFTVQDEDGTALADTDLDTLTVTLYNVTDGAVINSRTATSILNANGGTVSGAGAGRWEMDPADTAIIGTGALVEDHVALFAWSWGGDADNVGRAEVVHRVNALTNVA
jgi:hypothetical protein